MNLLLLNDFFRKFKSIMIVGYFLVSFLYLMNQKRLGITYIQSGSNFIAVY